VVSAQARRRAAGRRGLDGEMSDVDAEGGRAWRGGSGGFGLRYNFVEGGLQDPRREQRRAWRWARNVALWGGLLALATLVAVRFVGAEDAGGRHRGFSAPDAALEADSDKVVVVSSTITCKDKGGCFCDCYWAYNPGACVSNDNSCCFNCCCYGWLPHIHDPTTTPRTTEAITVSPNRTQATGRSGHSSGEGKGSAGGSATVLSTTTTTGAPTSTAVAAASHREVVANCLCVLDVDRTLTGSQGDLASCPRNLRISGVPDFAFSGGDLTLSEFGQAYNETFCSRCHVGIVSAGQVGGDGEKKEILRRLPGASELPQAWSVATSIETPLVVGCPDAQKSICVKGVYDWYIRAGFDIRPHSVYFFDDHMNVFDGFARYGFNARQVSCDSRDATIANLVGLCGATTNEILKKQGIFTCP